MSGVKMTSIFGSLVNMCIFMMVCNNLNLKYSYLAVQGDDLDVSFR